MKFYEDIYRSMNLIAGAGLLLWIEDEALHDIPHIEPSDIGEMKRLCHA